MGMLFEIAQRLKNAKVQVHLRKDNSAEKTWESDGKRGDQQSLAGSFIVDLQRRKMKD